MADFNEYPPNILVKDALIVRQQATADHAVVPYTGEDLNRPRLGPANPFRDEAEHTALKRKNILTGQATETYISEHTFRAKHRAVERGGGPEREFLTNKEEKAQAAKLRATRESKGSATIADGDNAYVGPWARYKRQDYEEVEVDEAELGSDEEYEIVEETDEHDVVPSGTLVSAPAESLARRKVVEARGEETTTFHAESQYDYLGRTYMHVPQDLDISLQKEVGSVTNYIPKKVVHTWKHHGNKAVTALRLFPQSSHLGLSGGADGQIKIWDVYRSRELLRSFSGHTKAITDLSFNSDGKQFLSGGFDRWIRLWDTETGQCINRFNSGKTPHVIKFNPSAEHGHEFLAGLSDNRILQYDSRSGTEVVQEYDHHLGAINTIEFVDENRRFMTTSDDRSLRVWEYGIPVEIKTIRYVLLSHPSISRSEANPQQRARYVCPYQVGAAPERQVCAVPVQRQLDCCLLGRVGQVPAEPQEVMAWAQHGWQRHWAHRQPRRPVRRLWRHGRLRLLLGLQDVQDVPQDPCRQLRRVGQLRRVVRAGDEQGVYCGREGRCQDVGLKAELPGWDCYDTGDRMIPLHNLEKQGVWECSLQGRHQDPNPYLDVNYVCCRHEQRLTQRPCVPSPRVEP